MSLFPGKIVKIISRKEKRNLKTGSSIFLYKTNDGVFVSCTYIQGEKALILKLITNENNRIYAYLSEYPFKNESVLLKLENSLKEFKDKQVYFNYLNILQQGRILCNIKKNYYDIYGVEIEDIILPLHGSYNLRYLSNNIKKRIYPLCNSLISNKKEITHYGIYWPGISDLKVYSAILRLRSKMNKYYERNAKILCYGFVDIEKWHLVTLSHFLRKKRKFNYSRLPVLCQEIRNQKRSALNGKKIKVSHCEVEKCIKEKAFPRAHKILENYLIENLKEAVTFWENPQTIKNIMIVREDIESSIMLVKIISSQKTKKNKYKNLIIYGIIYGWNPDIKEDIPLIHCNFVTFFEGNKSKQIIKNVPEYFGRIQLIKQ